MVLNKKDLCVDHNDKKSQFSAKIKISEEKDIEEEEAKQLNKGSCYHKEYPNILSPLFSLIFFHPIYFLLVCNTYNLVMAHLAGFQTGRVN